MPSGERSDGCRFGEVCVCVVEADETPTATAARRSTGDGGERSIADEDEAAVADDVKCMYVAACF